MTTSECITCGLPKKGNQDLFYRRPKQSDPSELRNQCKTCVKARVNKNSKRPEVVAQKRLAARTYIGRWSAASREAKRRNLDWSISLEDFCILNRCECTYCGGPLPPTGSGLDRVDNKQGYSIDNVTPCCDWCNVARRDHFTYQEMLLHIGPAIRQIREIRYKDHRGT